MVKHLPKTPRTTPRSPFDPCWKGGVDIPKGWDDEPDTCLACGHDLSHDEEDWGKGYCFDCRQQCSLCFEHRDVNETVRNGGAFICDECLKVENN